MFLRQWKVGGGVGMGLEGITFAVNHLSGLISCISWLIDHISLSLFSRDGYKIRNLILVRRYLEEEGEKERKRIFIYISLFSLFLALKFACG